MPDSRFCGDGVIGHGIGRGGVELGEKAAHVEGQRRHL